MGETDLWPMIHERRAALADVVEGLSPEQWDASSLCTGWRVRDAVAHVIATAHTTPGSFFRDWASAGFRFHRFSAGQLESYAGLAPAELVSGLRETTTLTSHPPGPLQTPLSEVVVHSEDITRGVGVRMEVPTATLVAVLDFYRRTQLLIGAKKRSTGLHLRATDVAWETGNGPEVSGPGTSLLLAMAGRPAGLADLTGSGVKVLTSRM